MTTQTSELADIKATINALQQQQQRESHKQMVEMQKQNAVILTKLDALNESTKQNTNAIAQVSGRLNGFIFVLFGTALSPIIVGLSAFSWSFVRRQFG